MPFSFLRLPNSLQTTLLVILPTVLLPGWWRDTPRGAPFFRHAACCFFPQPPFLQFLFGQMGTSLSHDKIPVLLLFGLQYSGPGLFNRSLCGSQFPLPPSFRQFPGNFLVALLALVSPAGKTS